MNKILASIVALAITVSFSSCGKKDKVNPASTYYLTCDINGVNKTFNDSAVVEHYPYNNGEEISVRTFAGSLPTSEMFAFGIDNFYGSFTATTFVDTGSAYVMVIGYHPKGNTDDGAYFAGQSATNTSGEQAKHFIITITSISSTEIKGTFSGDMFLGGSPNIHVTNGKFNLKIDEY